jgi:hypothetical protein
MGSQVHEKASFPLGRGAATKASRLLQQDYFGALFGERYGGSQAREPAAYYYELLI